MLHCWLEEGQAGFGELKEGELQESPNPCDLAAPQNSHYRCLSFSRKQFRLQQTLVLPFAHPNPCCSPAQDTGLRSPGGLSQFNDPPVLGPWCPRPGVELMIVAPASLSWDQIKLGGSPWMKGSMRTHRLLSQGLRITTSGIHGAGNLPTKAVPNPVWGKEEKFGNRPGQQHTADLTNSTPAMFNTRHVFLKLLPVQSQLWPKWV